LENYVEPVPGASERRLGAAPRAHNARSGAFTRAVMGASTGSAGDEGRHDVGGVPVE
jgi:hypothetical protein